MEAVKAGLEIISTAISTVGIMGGLVLISGIVAATFLVYDESITLDELKKFLSRDKDKRNKW